MGRAGARRGAPDKDELQWLPQQVERLAEPSGAARQPVGRLWGRRQKGYSLGKDSALGVVFEGRERAARGRGGL